jgi:hypothetical protein
MRELQFEFSLTQTVEHFWLKFRSKKVVVAGRIPTPVAGRVQVGEGLGVEA